MKEIEKSPVFPRVVLGILTLLLAGSLVWLRGQTAERILMERRIDAAISQVMEFSGRHREGNGSGEIPFWFRMIYPKEKAAQGVLLLLQPTAQIEEIQSGNAEKALAKAAFSCGYTLEKTGEDAYCAKLSSFSMDIYCKQDCRLHDFTLTLCAPNRETQVVPIRFSENGRATLPLDFSFSMTDADQQTGYLLLEGKISCSGKEYDLQNCRLYLAV